MREVRFSTPRQSYRHHEDLAPIDGVSQLFVVPAFPAFVPRGITYACHKRPDCVAAQLDKVLSTHMGKRSMYLMSSLLLHTYYIAAAPSLMRPSDVWASNPREACWKECGSSADHFSARRLSIFSHTPPLSPEALHIRSCCWVPFIGFVRRTLGSPILGSIVVKVRTVQPSRPCVSHPPQELTRLSAGLLACYVRIDRSTCPCRCSGCYDSDTRWASVCVSDRVNLPSVIP